MLRELQKPYAATDEGARSEILNEWLDNDIYFPLITEQHRMIQLAERLALSNIDVPYFSFLPHSCVVWSQNRELPSVVVPGVPLEVVRSSIALLSDQYINTQVQLITTALQSYRRFSKTNTQSVHN